MLKRLSMRYLTISDEAVLRIATGCPRLEYINLGYCELITDKSLLYLSLHCADLKSVNLWRCSSLSTEGVKALLLRGHKIRSLDVSCWGNAVTDEFLQWVSKNALALDRIQLQESYAITDVGFASLGQLPKLKHVDVYRCDRISDDGIFALAHQTTQLRVLNCSGCPKIQFQSLNYLISRCPMLTPQTEAAGIKI